MTDTLDREAIMYSPTQVSSAMMTDNSHHGKGSSSSAST